MAKKTTNISYGVQGMNRSGVGYQLDDKAYTIQLNGNVETDEYGGLSLTNEHSNLLCSRLKPGFKVIGSKFDINDSRVYLFITNPETGVSEIGYIPYLHTVDETQDINKECNCTYENILSTPLEDQEQIEGCEYITMLNDGCEEAKNCLGFSIYHPIKSIIIKGEKATKKMYWAVKGQHPRYIDLYDLDKYKYKGQESCGEIICAEGIDVTNPSSIEDCKTCLDCEKLKMFNISSIPTIVDYSVVYGGNLKMGVYEVLIAYCDRLGTETSTYYSKTNPISIFDKGNYIMEQPQLADRTNLAISLEIEDLDISQQYYKVVVIAKSDINGESTSFEQGVYPITNTTVLITTELGKKDITLQDIFVDNITFKSFGGLATSNNYLFGYDYEVEKEWNLQPVVSLLGGFVKWQTHQAKSSLYEDGAAAAKYSGFMRDEVYPLSIQFGTEHSYFTAKFILIGRPPTVDEIEEIVIEDSLPAKGSNSRSYYTSDVNAQSIMEYSPNCAKNGRRLRWQYHNTATFSGYCPSYDVDDFETIVRQTFEVCKVRLCDNGDGVLTPCQSGQNCTGCTDVIDTIPPGSIRLPIDTSNFKGLKNWFRDNKELIYKCCDISRGGTGKYCNNIDKLTPGDCPVLPDEYPPEICNLVLNTYPEYHCRPSLPFDICEDCEEGDLGPNECLKPVLADCSEDIPFPEDVYIKDVYDERIFLVEKEWNEGGETSEYTKTAPFGKPLVYIENTGTSESEGFRSGRLVDFSFANGCGDSGSNCFLTAVLKRLSEMMYNDSCSSPSEFFEKEYSHFTYFFDYQFQESCGEPGVYDKLVTEHPSIPFPNTLELTDIPYTYMMLEFSDSVGFPDTITSKALWFRVTKEDLRFENEGEEPSVIVETTVAQTGFLDDYPNIYETFFEYAVVNRNYRVTILDSCAPDANILHCEIVGQDTGWWKMIKESDFTNTGEMYVVFDSPIHHLRFVDIISDNPRPYNCSNNTSEFNVIVPMNGTINIVKRYKEYKYAEVDHGGIDISKKETYVATCNYIVPYINDCKPSPYAYGEFSYWESVEQYPDNDELYDSSKLKLSPEDLPERYRNKFEEYYTSGISGGDYVLDADKADFRCKPIRHYKFPDNKVFGASFIFDQPTGEASDTIIYPLGVSLDNGIVNSFLDIAVKNGLVTKEQRDSITHYQIFRGDRVIHKSVLYKGISNDMYRYYNKGKETWFRNFPFNSLGENQLIYDSNSRGSFVQHPYSNEGNSKYSLIAPEVYKGMPRDGTEVAIEGYQMGYSEGTFREIEGHSKWVILGDRAKDLASRLATLEVAFDSAMNIADSLIGMANSMWGGMLALNYGFGFAIAGNVLVTVANVASSMIFNYAKKRYEWLEIFKNNGTPYNFAYRYVGTGNYNFFLRNQEEDSTLRGLSASAYIKSGNMLVTDERGKKTLKINNIEREQSYFMSFGDKYPIEYQSSYSSWDNVDESSSNSSRYLSSDSGCNDGMDTKRVGSPYMSVKVYNPAQYGTVDSISWINTGKPIKLDKGDYSVNTCDGIFGGDVFITRVGLKNKYRFFISDAMNNANRVPFDYFIYSNVGSSRFFASYETPIVRVSNGNPIPYADTVFNFNCPREDYSSSSDFYVKPEQHRNSKFYLHYYGIPYFFVESTINNEYRYGGPELHEQFYPNVDVIEWTEEKKNSIMYDNVFSYNNTYSYSGTEDGSRILPSFYNREEWDKLYEYPNGIVWSQQDNSEQDLRDPWLVFKPLDKYQFSSEYGKLIDVTGIESEQVLARFENNVVVFNAVDTLADRLTTSNYKLGTGGIFQTRPAEFSRTDLGEMGTQSTELVSNEFGHFWVDAKRGKIFQLLPNAKGLVEISAMNTRGEPTHMQKWFKRHLPFKILRGLNIEGLEESSPILDNKYYSLGINMWWDSKFKRLFITKRDYKTNRKDLKYDGEKIYQEGGLADRSKNILKDLEDVSWTVSYSPIYGSWLSYHSFTPDYSISYHDFFQTGLNYSVDEKEQGIWSHLLTNKSFQVYYGKKYPWVIEVPFKNQLQPKILRSVTIAASTYRYHNEYDFAEVRNKAFNKVAIYNMVNNTGMLNIEYSDYADDYKYPIQIDRLNQAIKGTHTKGNISFNYLYNRVINQDNNIPIWLWDANEINKNLNPQAISFTSKSILERMRGEMFFMRLTQDKSSQYKQVYKWGFSEEQVDTF